MYHPGNYLLLLAVLTIELRPKQILDEITDGNRVTYSLKIYLLLTK